MSEPLIDITVADGKYRIVQEAEGGTLALRYGCPWLNVTDIPGGKMILAMAYELEELRGKSISNEAAIAVGEDAFKAGFDAAADMLTKCSPDEFVEDRDRAWSAYEPSEDIKALV